MTKVWKVSISLLSGVESMSKLLNAGFTNLFKSRIFYMGMLVMIAQPLYLIVLHYQEMKQNVSQGSRFEDSITVILFMISIIIAVLSSSLCGTEYHDRTLQNKIAIGHSRINIYLTSLIINVVACAFFLLLNFAVLFSVGNIVIGAFAMTASEIIRTLLMEISVTTAYASIFTMIAMLIQTRSTSSVVSVLSVMSMFFSGISVFQKLQQADESTNTIFYNFLSDFLPSCQSMRIMQENLPSNSAQMVGYDFLIIAVTTIIGVFIFRRKDLK